MLSITKQNINVRCILFVGHPVFLGGEEPTSTTTEATPGEDTEIDIEYEHKKTEISVIEKRNVLFRYNKAESANVKNTIINIK